MNILLIAPARIGDAVLSTGVLAHLAAAHPNARITLACGSAAMSLFAAAPNVVKRIETAERNWGLHWFDLWRECVKQWWGWDLIVDLRGSLIPQFLIARRRRVCRSRGRHRHRLYGFAKAMRLAEPPVPTVWTAPEHETEAARLVPEGGPVLGIGPTADWPGRVWPAEKFVALIERLTGPGGILPGARVAVFGTAAERDIARPVLDAVPAERLIDLVGAVDLPTVAAALAYCALYVGNDSGLMHLAAAAGVPTLGLFGPGRPEFGEPWGERTAAVRAAAPCDTFVPPRYDRRTTGTLMDSLDVDAVEEAAVALWRRCGAKAA